MSEKLGVLRRLPMSAGALVLTAAMLSGSAYGAAASTAHRRRLRVDVRRRTRWQQPGLQDGLVTGVLGAVARGYRESDTVLMVGACGHAPTDAVFTWAKARKLLHIR